VSEETPYGAEIEVIDADGIDDDELDAIYGARPPESSRPPDFAALAARLASRPSGEDGFLPSMPTVLHWPEIPAEDAPEEWQELREWVDELLERFEFISHHVVPDCWYRHNELVELLSALRGHEEFAFLPNNPPNAGTDFFRTMRDVLMIAAEWVGQLGCGTGHVSGTARLHTITEDDWQATVAADVAKRKASESS